MATKASYDLKALDDELNRMILSGQALEALHKFYDEDCAMQENNDAPCRGKAANLEREKEFFATVEQFHGAKVLAQGIGEDVTFSEWENDVTLKGMPRMTMNQVAERRWKDGKIVHERFFHK